MTVKWGENSALRLLLKVFCSLSGEQKEPEQRKPHYVRSSYGDEWRSMRRSRLAAGRPLTHPAKRKSLCCFSRKRSSVGWKALVRGSLYFVSMQRSLIHATFWAKHELQSYSATGNCIALWVILSVFLL